MSNKNKQTKQCECDQPRYPGAPYIPGDCCEWCGLQLKEIADETEPNEDNYCGAV